MFDRTLKCGDVRIGLDLIKRSVMNAEKSARTTVTDDDVTDAFSIFISRDLRLAGTLSEFSPKMRQTSSSVLRR